MCQCPCVQPSYIDNPKQIKLGFKDMRFPDKYDEGFETGINWDSNYHPGGPFIYRNDAKSLAAHDVWHEGFKAGLELRLKTNAHFAAWWDANHRKTGASYPRYIAPECDTIAA